MRGRWYLVACERSSDHWRTYALDRISDVRTLGGRLSTPPPPDDASAFVISTLAHWAGDQLVRVRLHTSADLARTLIDPTVGDIDDDDDCILTFGTHNLDWAARWLLYRNIDFDVLEPSELSHHLCTLGSWLQSRYPDPANA